MIAWGARMPQAATRCHSFVRSPPPPHTAHAPVGQLRHAGAGVVALPPADHVATAHAAHLDPPYPGVQTGGRECGRRGMV